MIWKLFKYDFRGVGKKLFPLYGLALLFALMSRFFVVETAFNGYSVGDSLYESSPIFRVFSGLVFGTAWIMVAAVFIVTFIMLLTKYFRSIYGEEGYLTHTLPISSSQKIIAKILTFYVWNLFAAIIAALCVFIMFFHWTAYMDFLEEFKEAFRYFLSIVTGREVFAGFLWLLILIISPIVSILEVYFCCAVGAMFKHKFIAGVCAYIVLTFLLSMISNITLTDRLEYMMMYDYMPVLELPSILLITCVIYTAIFFFGTKYMLDRQLNLE